MFGRMEHAASMGGALLVACVLVAGSASADDLGGGCCADLEERVAEFEATTARKGNRVVSLQISGFVNEALVAWDDGKESDAYLVTNTGYQSRLSLGGTGQIDPDLKAGFLITLGIWGSPSLAVDQTNDESVSLSYAAQPDSIIIRESKIYLESTRLGRVTLGQQSMAADDITAINVARSVYVDSSAQQVFVGGFRLRDNDTLSRFRFNNLMGADGTNPPGDGARFDVIRYDSASIAGLKVSASWGEDNAWDMALRYAGLLGGRYKAAAGIAYGARTDRDTGINGTSTNSNNGCIVLSGDVDCHQIGMAGSVMDMGTGLFIHGAYGITTDQNRDKLGAGNKDDETSFWYLHGGIEKKWLPYGLTTLFIVHGQFESGFNSFVLSPSPVVTGRFDRAEVEMSGLGINQNFEAVSLDLYLKYNEYSASADNIVSSDGFAGSHVDFNDFGAIYAGARISF
jgi:hypothetical protein